MSRIAEAQNLTDRIAEQLGRKLVLGEWVPGQRLSEASLCESLDISRSTLREAFRVLTKEGLLSHEPNKGVSVAMPSMPTSGMIIRVSIGLTLPRRSAPKPRSHDSSPRRTRCDGLQTTSMTDSSPAGRRPERSALPH